MCMCKHFKNDSRRWKGTIMRSRIYLVVNRTTMRTSSTQFEMMVDFMQRNGDLAKPGGGPRGRQWATNKWRELAVKLNSDGTGECRSEEKWRKVWTDFKNNTKRKAAKLNRSMNSTGGGPALKLTLTDLELKVLNIMGEQAATGMANISEVGFEHVTEVNLGEGSQVQQEVELALQDVDSNQIEFPAEYMDLEKEPSCQLDKGDEEWNLPGTSQEQLSPKPAPARKWTPLAKKARPEKSTKIKDLSDRFLMAERDRDKMFYELEKERIRQRDFELELQAKWLAFMNEALSVFRKVMEEKSKDE